MKIPRTALVFLLAVTGSLQADGCRLFVIGDSITVRYTPALRLSLPGDWTVDGKKDIPGAPPANTNLDIPTGANGGDSNMVLGYLQARAAHDPIHADLLLLNCGLHDVKCDLKTGAKQVDLATYRKNLRAILRVAADMRLSVVWVRTTPVVDSIHNSRQPAFARHAADVAEYNAAADEIMRETGTPEIDLNQFTAQFIPASYVDHVHYDDGTAAKQAAFVAGALEAIWNRSRTAKPRVTRVSRPVKADAANCERRAQPFSSSPATRVRRPVLL